MSQWRKQALEILPELHRTITAEDVDNPMMLWLELSLQFSKLCEQQPPDLDLLQRIWHYAKWSLEHGHPDTSNAAAVAFCEHLIDTPQRIAILPRIMQRSDFLGIRSLLEYHHSPAEVDACLKQQWGQSSSCSPSHSIQDSD